MPRAVVDRVAEGETGDVTLCHSFEATLFRRSGAAGGTAAAVAEWAMSHNVTVSRAYFSGDPSPSGGLGEGPRDRVVNGFAITSSANSSVVGAGSGWRLLLGNPREVVIRGT